MGRLFLQTHFCWVMAEYCLSRQGGTWLVAILISVFGKLPNTTSFVIPLTFSLSSIALEDHHCLHYEFVRFLWTTFCFYIFIYNSINLYYCSTTQNVDRNICGTYFKPCNNSHIIHSLCWRKYMYVHSINLFFFFFFFFFKYTFNDHSFEGCNKINIKRRYKTLMEDRIKRLNMGNLVWITTKYI